MPDELTPPENPSDLTAGRYVVHPDARSTPEQVQANYPDTEIPIPEGSTLLAHTTQDGTQQAQGTQPQEGGAQAEGTGEHKAESTPEAQQSTQQERIGAEFTPAELRELARLREEVRKAPQRWKGLQKGQHQGDNKETSFGFPQTAWERRTRDRYEYDR